MKISLTIITCIALLISIYYLIKKRKMFGVTGFKTLLTPICFYLVAINSILLIWLERFGILFWTINVLLLLFAFRFMKHLPNHVEAD